MYLYLGRGIIIININIIITIIIIAIIITSIITQRPLRLLRTLCTSPKNNSNCSMD